MDFPESKSMEEAFAQAEALAKLDAERREAEERLANATTPDRFNEDWRFGSPHKHAKALVELLESAVKPAGRITVQSPGGEAYELGMQDDPEGEEIVIPSIGSDKLLALHVERCGSGAAVYLEEGADVKEPVTITYETDGLFLPHTSIIAEPSAKAHIIEKHIVKGTGVLFATRTIIAAPGSDIKVELHEEGTGESRALNMTHIQALSAKVRHLTCHTGHAWAREETVAEILRNDTDVRLYSANRLADGQTLDQHTRQIHTWGEAASDLLYKNVVDGNATAIFAGNIFVAPGAHRTDAYQANRNMLLSEKATVHSLPGLEILADKVKCSHGSANAPMDEEQLFYLLSRGIPRHEAQLLVADGFLNDVWEKFNESQPEQ